MRTYYNSTMPHTDMPAGNYNVSGYVPVTPSPPPTQTVLEFLVRFVLGSVLIPSPYKGKLHGLPGLSGRLSERQTVPLVVRTVRLLINTHCAIQPQPPNPNRQP